MMEPPPHPLLLMLWVKFQGIYYMRIMEMYAQVGIVQKVQSLPQPQILAGATIQIIDK